MSCTVNSVLFAKCVRFARKQKEVGNRTQALKHKRWVGAREQVPMGGRTRAGGNAREQVGTHASWWGTVVCQNGR